MNKKKYIKPEAKMIISEIEDNILVGSGNTGGGTGWWKGPDDDYYDQGHNTNPEHDDHHLDPYYWGNGCKQSAIFD